MSLLYHYTDEFAVRELLESIDDFGVFYEVGQGNVYGDGMYATSIAPVDDPDCLDDVIRQCFDGSRTELEVSWVLVLDDADGRFEQVEEAQDQWVLAGSPLEMVDISQELVQVSRWRAGHWQIVTPDRGGEWIGIG